MDFYEQQAFNMRNQPGLSIADARFIDHWVDRARASDRYRVTDWTRDRRERNKKKAQEVLDRLSAVQDDFVKVRKQAERNEVPWSDLAKAQRRLRNERTTLEKVLESMEASEASASRMDADPSAYMNGFYERHPTLQDRRPNLAADLAEDQHKRGVNPN